MTHHTDAINTDICTIAHAFRTILYAMLKLVIVWSHPLHGTIQLTLL